MKRYVSTINTLSIALILSGCGGNSLLVQQQNKDSYCLGQVDAAYSTLMLSKSAKEKYKKPLEKQAFKILKKAELLNCTSVYPVLYLHYTYGIGTQRSPKDALYYKKMVNHFLATDTEGRFEYQGITVPNMEKKK